MPAASALADAELYKSASAAREVAERRERERRRALVVLCARFLASHGYDEACERLSAASGVSLSKVDVADNIDLARILGEWEEQQEARWGRRPQLTRALVKELPLGGGGRRDAPTASASMTGGAQDGGGGESGLASSCFSGQMAARQRREKAAAAAAAAAGSEQSRGLKGPPGAGCKGPLQQKPMGAGAREGSTHSGFGGSDTAQQQPSSSTDQLGAAATDLLGVEGRSCGQPQGAGCGPLAEGEASDEDPLDCTASGLLGGIPACLQGELRDLARALLRDVCSERPGVGWGDVAGLEDAKRLLHEAVVMPAKYPELFTGLLAPWRGVLLYGPPGTGKTLLAKAVATQCRTTFFNVSASSLISKWRGDSEKIVRVLFELARHHAPSTIFVDEVDAIMGARGAQGEHEASRRMKTELLVQLDGLARRGNERVFVLAATNMPWELDTALLRRLEKRILVPLPDRPARLTMLRTLLAGRCSCDGGNGSGSNNSAACAAAVGDRGPQSAGGGAREPGTAAGAAGGAPDLEAVADASEGFSGSDIAVLAKEAAMRPLRRLMQTLEPEMWGSAGGGGGGGGGGGSAGARMAQAANSRRSAGFGGGGDGVDAAQLLGPVTSADLAASLAATRPTGGAFAAEYVAFAERYGQVL